MSGQLQTYPRADLGDLASTTIIAGMTLPDAAERAVQGVPLDVLEAWLRSRGLPFIVAAKNLTISTAGAPADIGTITLPAWCTRYIVGLGESAQPGRYPIEVDPSGGTFVVESAAGDLTSTTFSVRDTSGGGGNVIAYSVTSNSVSIITGVGAWPLLRMPVRQLLTGSTLYVSQNANSSNAGTCSVYLTIVPLL